MPYSATLRMPLPPDLVRKTAEACYHMTSVHDAAWPSAHFMPTLPGFSHQLEPVLVSCLNQNADFRVGWWFSEHQSNPL